MRSTRKPCVRSRATARMPSTAVPLPPTSGAPCAGGIAVLQMLALLERTPFERAPAQSAVAVHYFAEAGRLAFADRARYAADSDFVPVPIARLLSSRYLDERAKLIGERSMRIAAPGDTESAGTSHLSI